MTDLAVLYDDPFWLVLVKALGVFVFLVVSVLLTIWGERRIVARMQMRVGPNRVGPFGILQGLADGIKLAFKEDIVPAGAHKSVFIIAPIISTIAAFLTFAVIPLAGAVSIFGEATLLQLTDFPVAVLYIVAIASIGIYGIVLGGWASGSTYPLLGSLRSSAQMISYEIAMGLSFVAVFLYASTMSTSGIVDAQANLWFGITLAPAFVIYVISMVGETNRAPFDLPEAEGELVGGFHTEYSSLKFAVFFLAEYVNMLTVSALAATLFLGGWQAPFGLPDGGWLGFGWFVLKLFGFVFLFIWLRGTLPRYRYDQFMSLGWKVLIPVSLGWIVLVSGVRAFRLEGVDTQTWLIAAAVVVLGALAASFAFEARGMRAEEADSGPGPERESAGWSHPVPPMPGDDVIEGVLDDDVASMPDETAEELTRG